MIVCSCNKTTTQQLKNAAHYLTAPDTKLLLNMVGWKSNCSICVDMLVLEARKAIEEVENNGNELSGV